MADTVLKSSGAGTTVRVEEQRPGRQLRDGVQEVVVWAGNGVEGCFSRPYREGGKSDPAHIKAELK